MIGVGRNELGLGVMDGWNFFLNVFPLQRMAYGLARFNHDRMM